jgi:phage baseplate assembly protein W
MAQIKQYFDIKFPFTSNNLDGFFIDLNETIGDKVLSEILHVIMTPKGGRLRMPDFGTDLAHYIFDQSDEKEWGRIKAEIKEAVAKYVPRASVNDVRVLREEGNDNTILVDLDYSVKVGITSENNRVVIKI